MISPLPDWATSIRPHQQQAREDIQRAFNGGAKVVWLDAPTGSGKTLIGDLVRRDLGLERALFVCSSKTLQDQVSSDFPYAEVLKGRANYPTDTEGVTCDSCTYGGVDAPCYWCSSRDGCSYQIAKRATRTAELGVLNTTYLLTEGSSPRSAFAGAPLIIADECDLLESELMRHVELVLPGGLLKALGTSAPDTGKHYKTIADWLDGIVAPRLFNMASRQRKSDPDGAKRQIRYRQMGAKTKWMAQQLIGGGWVRADRARDFAMKPVTVERFGQERLWGLGQRWLCMSGTIIDARRMSEDLGLREDEWELVSVANTFPVENRPIRVVPVADLRNGPKWEEEAGRMAKALVNVARLHPDDRILVHSVSYKLTEVLTGGLEGAGRPVFTYRNAAERDEAIAKYRANERSVLVAPSLERGVDFSGEDCRVVVVAKVPYPNLGDRQIGARLHSHGGQDWYTVQTVRSLVQMTGRGVRSADDWATNYILDRGFLRLLRERRELFPQWWLDAVDTKFPTYNLTK